MIGEGKDWDLEVGVNGLSPLDWSDCKGQTLIVSSEGVIRRRKNLRFVWIAGGL